MTEAEWNACKNPGAMLHFLHGRGSQRKLRLFVCACGRKRWEQLVDKRSRRAVEVRELFADGRADEKELGQAQIEAGAAGEELEEFCVPGAPETAEENWSAAEIAWEIASTHPDIWLIARDAGETIAAGDIFGNPFRPISLDSSWLTFSVTNLAETIYQDRSFAHLPILADALEDAGCTNADILNHCRQPGEHVRGCWVIDLLTGRK